MTTSTAQTEEAKKAIEEWRTQLQSIAVSFVEPLATYKQLLQDKTDAERAAADETAAKTADASDSWKDHVSSVGVSVGELAAKMKEQLDNQAQWRTNLGFIAQWAGIDVANYLAKMGKDGVDLVAQMKDGTTAEAQAMREQIKRAIDMGGAEWTASMDNSMRVMEYIGWKGGQTTASAIAKELGIGVNEVIKIAHNYGVELAEGINPILSGIGKPLITAGPRRGNSYAQADGSVLSFYADGGSERHVAQHAPAGAWRVWAEPETKGESYIPHAPEKRRRSLAIWRETGKILDAPEMEFYAYGGVQPHVARSGQIVENLFGPLPGGIGGVGARANASDHPSGHALDFMTMTNRMLGDRIAGFLQSNAAAHAIKYLIWKQAINQGSGWTKMEDRGSITANHFDHVHASYLRAGQAGGAFSGAGGTLMPDLPPVPNFPYNGIVQSATKWAEAAREQAQSWLDGILGGPAVAGPGAPGEAGSIKEQVRGVANRYGWGAGAQWNAIDQIVQKESSWNPNAANPRSSARGLFQKMTSVHGPIEPTPAGQAEWGLNYIKGRYQTPVNALAFHNRNGYYESGAVIPQVLDQGGLWKPGLGINLTDGLERVLTPEQDDYWRKFVDVAEQWSRNGGSAVFSGNLVLDSGELLGRIHGVMDERDSEDQRYRRSVHR